MCLRLVFLLITRVAAWLRLSRRGDTRKTAEILILRRQLTVLQRRQPRPEAELGGPCAARGPARRATPSTAPGPAAAGDPGTIVRRHREIVRRRWPPGPRAAGPAGRRPGAASGRWPAGWPARTPNGGTAGSTASWPDWESRSRRRPSGRSSGQRHRPRAAAGLAAWSQFLRPGPARSWRATSSRSTCSTAPRPTSWLSSSTQPGASASSESPSTPPGNGPPSPAGD
jgi:hypothetical protein